MNFLRRHKRIWILLVSAVCLVSILATFGYRDELGFIEKYLGFVISPVQGFFTSAGVWVGGKKDFIVHLSEIETENKRLKDEIERLMIDNSRLKSAEESALEMSRLLDIDKQYADYKKVGARIRHKDPGNWYNTFYINKGTDDGLERNMVVLAAGGLAGRITKAGKNYARVVTLVDDTSSISAKTARTGDTGFVRGDAKLMLEGKCLMEFTNDAEVIIGDEIVTSHLSSIYPPGITIGTVLDVSVDSSGIKHATVQPDVNFRYLDTVLVIAELFEYEMID